MVAAKINAQCSFVQNACEHCSPHVAAARQISAIMDDGDRRKRLAKVTTPTLVIHGVGDPLAPVDGGRDTAQAIKRAKLLEIDGVGHDLPLELAEQIADAIAAHASGDVT